MDLTAIAIVGIVFGCITAITKSVLKHRSESKMVSSDSHALKSEITQLKERVATLEKIVTDEKYSLKREFDNL